MVDGASILLFPGDTPRSSPSTPKSSHIYFDRRELTLILNIYGRKVAAGDWKDYSITPLKRQAIFSVFRRASERPLYQIIKDPSLRNKQGIWHIRGFSGQILRRGHELDKLLLYFKDI